MLQGMRPNHDVQKTASTVHVSFQAPAKPISTIFTRDDQTGEYRWQQFLVMFLA